MKKLSCLLCLLILNVCYAETFNFDYAGQIQKETLEHLMEIKMELDDVKISKLVQSNSMINRAFRKLGNVDYYNMELLVNNEHKVNCNLKEDNPNESQKEIFPHIPLSFQIDDCKSSTVRLFQNMMCTQESKCNAILFMDEINNPLLAEVSSEFDKAVSKSGVAYYPNYRLNFPNSEQLLFETKLILEDNNLIEDFDLDKALVSRRGTVFALGRNSEEICQIQPRSFRRNSSLFYTGRCIAPDGGFFQLEGLVRTR